MALFGLALSTVREGQAIAAPSARPFHQHRVDPVEPGSFDGNVRRLPHVPSSRRPDVEVEAPNVTKNSVDGPGSGAVAPNMPAPIQTFDGLRLAGTCTGGPCGAGFPPDTVGDVGPNNYVEAVNTSVGIFSKTTGAQQAAFTFNSLWSGAGTGTPCDTNNNGDPTVVYDPIADRWFVADFSWTDIQNGPYYECVAVSKTGNPVAGGWWLYPIRADDAAHPYLPDYPKMGIWPDGLYMSANMFDCLTAGCSSATYKEVRVWAFNRTVMEAGAALQGVVVDTSATYFSMLPSNLRGTPPPVGTPNYFISESQSVFGFEVFKFHVDWVTPASSTFTGPTTVSQTSYSFASGPLVPQPGTATLLDSLEDRLMMQAQYRNISGVESLWVSHTVASAPTGVQWAQINVTGGTIATTPVQQQIWRNVNSDGVSRWMPSLAVDRLGNMAVGYSASSSTVFPSVRYAGRLAADPLNSLAQGEATMFAGTGSQAFNCGGPCSRWGDYTSMSVDPVDDCTFWYVGEYYVTTGSTDWHTRIGSFKFPGCAPPPPVCTITGTAGNDTLTGTAGDDVICGLGGNDILKGLGGNDSLSGGGGKDTLYPGIGDDVVNGGAALDTVSYSDLTAGATVNLSVPSTGGAAGTDTLSQIERATGTKFVDTITGSAVSNILKGLGGNDSVFGLGGDDTLDGGPGTDSLDGGVGTDTCKNGETNTHCEL